MIVTNIEAVTSAKYKVYLDGVHAFLLYKKELSRYHIAVGEAVTREACEKIRTEIVLKRAKLRALHLLNDMGRTKFQLCQKLERDGYPEDIVEEAASYAESFGYINDENYARIFVESRKSKKSRKEICAGLLQRGIDKELAEQVFAEYYGEEDACAAITGILKKKHFDPEKADRKETQKMFGYLARKGFKCEDIFRATEMLDIYDKTV